MEATIETSRTSPTGHALRDDTLRMEPAWAALRAAYGLWYVPHGMQKLFGMFSGSIAGAAKGAAQLGFRFPSPEFWAYAIGCLEFFGGLLLVVGLFTRPVAFFFGAFMLGACFYHAPNGYFWTKLGAELPLLLLVFALILLWRGGGLYSLDHRRRFPASAAPVAPGGPVA